MKSKVDFFKTKSNLGGHPIYTCHFKTESQDSKKFNELYNLLMKLEISILLNFISSVSETL